jgi:hypothetical protein
MPDDAATAPKIKHAKKKRQKWARTSVILLVEISPLSCDRVAALHVGRGHEKWGWLRPVWAAQGAREVSRRRADGGRKQGVFLGLVDFLPVCAARACSLLMLSRVLLT